MGSVALPSAIRVKRRSVTPLKVSNEKRCRVREAEDLVVFSPKFYKICWKDGTDTHSVQVEVAIVGTQASLGNRKGNLCRAGVRRGEHEH